MPPRRQPAPRVPTKVKQVMSSLGLQGKSAIVTGGASGIGRAITKLFVARGARIVVVDLHQETGGARP
ncbi:SDR family NAD(P)-dependent oxidoreductase [Streptomyces pilosus]